MPWSAAKDEAQRIRFAVFVDEQQVPAELEVDEIDVQCVHALAFHESQAIGTGRLLPDGHIGRMAVMKAWRGRGVGGAILQALIQAAWERGDRRIVLSAQVHALPFYKRHRFVPYGDVYDEAGIPHQAMRLTLR
jgi:predicted GNAT family N-acyltransferase